MKIKAEQLQSKLSQGLPPVILISGDAPLLVQETADSVRSHLLAQGYERNRHSVESGFVWNELLEDAGSLSLFSSYKLLELAMPNGKPGTEGSGIIKGFCQNPPADTVLLIVTGKLDGSAQRSAWHKAIDKAGWLVQLWPPTVQQMPGWIRQRLQKAGFKPDQSACEILSSRTEGNLLAASQEVEKLALLLPAGPLSGDAVAQAVADSARYDIFQWVDACLAGDAERVCRVLEGLKAEGDEPTLLVWALARELRTLSQVVYARAAGQNPDAALDKAKTPGLPPFLWDKRKPLLKSILRRHGNIASWQSWLEACGEADRICKGMAPGDVWLKLLSIGLAMAGRPVEPL
ncbi:DNA polymerase III subunit delta [Pelagibaculum spongiae]|uniref:DNA polymerase III subunit delta n=1 Tax=Pelagibaculum spongiae TaxID=2080658 RepID=A0A2V1GZD6_9GAMM|nr:DNA polymerase III subunit delta [Pelagibaculum spongiae]PVZ72106.1 DNA polymerase III subunit delta [Pelagibaculum spongiae]